MKCDLCGWDIEVTTSGWDRGNNPAPLLTHPKRCCDWCNSCLVVPLRIRIMTRPKELGEQEGASND